MGRTPNIFGFKSSGIDFLYGHSVSKKAERFNRPLILSVSKRVLPGFHDRRFQCCFKGTMCQAHDDGETTGFTGHDWRDTNQWQIGMSVPYYGSCLQALVGQCLRIPLNQNPSKRGIQPPHKLFTKKNSCARFLIVKWQVLHLR